MQELKHTETNAIDHFEAEMLERFPIVECPLRHIFTDGLYTREITMPAGSLVTSKIHKTEHPFVVPRGTVSVWTDNEGEVLIKAPFVGITKPGTRRVLFVHEETVWLTFHADPSNCKDVDQIEERIIEKHSNPLLPDEVKNKIEQLHRHGLEEKTIRSQLKVAL